MGSMSVDGGFSASSGSPDLGAEPCIGGVSDWGRRGCASEGECSCRVAQASKKEAKLS